MARIDTAVGWIDWVPTPGTQRAAIYNAVLERVRAPGYVALGTREFGYELKDAGVIPSKAQFSEVTKVLTNMRRAGVIPMDAVVDGRSIVTGGYDHEDEDGLRSFLLEQAQYARFDLQRGQETRVDIWCEAQAQIRHIRRVTWDLGPSVLSGGGFDPVRLKHDRVEQYREWLETGVCEEVVVVHWSDGDKSGLEIYEKLREEIERGWGRNLPITLRRAGVTREQCRQYGMTWGSAELDGIPLAERERLYRESVAEHLDLDQVGRMRVRQQEIRDRVVADLEGAL
jgi:hypothetical protein